MNQEVEICTWSELKELIRKTEINVQWQIKSDIGPGWIGRGKSVTFMSNNKQFRKNDFHTELVEELLSTLTSLDKYKDHIIDGKGKLIIEDNAITFHYRWEGTIPYQYPDIKGNGKEIIYTS